MLLRVLGSGVPPGVGRGEAAGCVVDNVVSVFELLGCGELSGVTGATGASGSVFELVGGGDPPSVGATEASGSPVATGGSGLEIVG
jgi:hypothetical protein